MRRRRLRELTGKIVRLRARDWAELLDAQLSLIRAQVQVHLRPRGQLIDRNEARDVFVEDEAVAATARRLGVAVDRAARFGVFRPLCLVRSLALHQMLERRGVAGSRIRIGVRRDDGQLTAHAWVEYGGTIIGDRDFHVARFTELADVRMRSS
jgi:hypothetical protein